MTQNKARRTNKIDFLQLPWAQGVPSSNLGARANLFSPSLAMPAPPAVFLRGRRIDFQFR
jgi:hypothetical protein